MKAAGQCRKKILGHAVSSAGRQVSLLCVSEGFADWQFSVMNGRESVCKWRNGREANPAGGG